MEKRVTIDQASDTTTPPGGDPGLEELVEDPQECAHCVAEAGGVCVWHDGFETGWEACMALVARHANGPVELVGADDGEEAL